MTSYPAGGFHYTHTNCMAYLYTKSVYVKLFIHTVSRWLGKLLNRAWVDVLMRSFPMTACSAVIPGLLTMWLSSPEFLPLARMKSYITQSHTTYVIRDQISLREKETLLKCVAIFDRSTVSVLKGLVFWDTVISPSGLFSLVGTRHVHNQCPLV